MLFLGTYIVTFALTERRLAGSHAQSLRAYYLGEAALNQAIFNLKNDPAFASNFETDPDWSATTTVATPLGITGGYVTTIDNTAAAHADITATANVSHGPYAARRVVRTKVFKAIGTATTTNPILDNAAYTDGNMEFRASNVAVHDGSLFSNNVIDAKQWSILTIDEDLRTTNNFLKHNSAQITTRGVNVNSDSSYVYAQNYPNGPADVLTMPAIDFDSSDPNSLRSRADTVYSEAEFETLLENNEILTLNGLIYVDGDITIRGAQTVTINGALVSDRDIDLGNDFCYWHGFWCGDVHVTVNSTGSGVSGLLAKRDISVGFFTESITVNGLLYANDKINIDPIVFLKTIDVAVHGGMIARKITIHNNYYGTIDIYRNDPLIAPFFATETSYAPVISIEHWEESY